MMKMVFPQRKEHKFWVFLLRTIITIYRQKYPNHLEIHRIHDTFAISNFFYKDNPIFNSWYILIRRRTSAPYGWSNSERLSKPKSQF
jgi:hypothetical protein